MAARFVFQGISFSWDQAKAAANARRHDGVKFEQAAEAFFDPFLKVVDASRNDEARDAIMGLDTRWRLLFVVYVEAEGDVIRIISARKATREEHEYYES
jgi:uncharacterized protein